jgi:3-hydroxybutyryl-CoA dehydrogenase
MAGAKIIDTRSAMHEPMRIDDVRRVAIVGAGTMGQQIGFQCAGHGYDVVVYDPDPKALEAAVARLDAYADELEAGGVITSELRPRGGPGSR